MKALSRLIAVVSMLACPIAGECRELLADYHITTWGPEAGLPAAATSIAQDSHGFLWVSTPSGVFRFDGDRFTPWNDLALPPLPRGPVNRLFTSRTGVLWMGFASTAGVVSLEGRTVRHYDEQDGLSAGLISAFAETRDGSMWVGNSAGLYRLQDAHWTKVEVAGGAVTALFTDRQDHLIVATPRGVFKRTSPDDRFLQIAPFSNVYAFAESASGELWTTDPVLAFRSVDQPQRPVPRWQRGIGSVLVEGRDGSRWVATVGQGLWRVRVRQDGTYSPPERLTTRTGLTTDDVLCLFEDRDGTLWMGISGGGLTRLVPHRITAITDVGLVRGVEPALQSGVWFGTTDEVRKTAKADHDTPGDEPANALRRFGAMRMDEHGALWVADEGELLRFGAGDSRASLRVAIGPRRISSVTSDHEGGVVLYEEPGSFFRWNNGRLTTIAVSSDVTRPGVTALFTDRSGRIWIASGQEQIAWMRCATDCRVEHVVRNLTAGSYYAFHEDASGAIWLGGNEGLTRFHDDRFETIDMKSAPRLSLVRAVEEDYFGYLWVGTRAGLVRMSKAEFDLMLKDRGRQLRHTYYDRTTGVAGGAGSPSRVVLPMSDNRRVARSADGRLWFVTGRGMTLVDPSQFLQPRQARPVQISSILVDDRVVEVGAPSEWPRPSMLTIRYAVLDLTSPMHRYRYRLEGYDRAWIEGTGHTATYTKLPHGSYRFTVQADTAEGSWSDAGAEVAFTIRPFFYETRWFGALMVVLAGIAIWVPWKLHLLQTRRQFRLVLAERARLSREIHDTLLQRLIGVMLQHDALSQEFSANKPLSDRLTRMRQELQQHVREARDAIIGLRSPTTTKDDFVSAIRGIGARATDGHAVAFSIRTEGEPYRFPASREGELLRICQEAIINAVRHARARAIRALVQYRPGTMVLTIEDNGCGFTPGQHLGSSSEHYGLIGMRERAESLSAALTIDSRLGGGTRIVIAAPVQRTILRRSADVSLTNTGHVR